MTHSPPGTGTDTGDDHIAACTHPLNYYQEQHLAKIERTLRHAEATRRDDHDSWLNSYQDDVRWLVNELKLRVPK